MKKRQSFFYSLLPTYFQSLLLKSSFWVFFQILLLEFSFSVLYHSLLVQSSYQSFFMVFFWSLLSESSIRVFFQSSYQSFFMVFFHGLLLMSSFRALLQRHLTVFFYSLLSKSPFTVFFAILFLNLLLESFSQWFPTVIWNFIPLTYHCLFAPFLIIKILWDGNIIFVMIMT